DIPIVPVLVDDGHMPRLDELPTDLAPFALRPAHLIDAHRWHADIQHLTEVLNEAIQRRELERLYAEAAQAFERQAWDAAIRTFGTIVAGDASYRDAAERLHEAEREQRLSDLHSEGRELRRARRREDPDAPFGRQHGLDAAAIDADQSPDEVAA